MVGRDVVGVSTGGGDAETRRPCSGMTPVYAMLGATVHRAVGVPFSCAAAAVLVCSVRSCV